MIPVVIGTNPERGHWLKDCIASIRATTRRRRVLIHRTGGYEIAALRTGCARYARFLFLQDSVTILKPEFWDIIDATEGPAWLTGGSPMHMGIHDRDQIAPVLAGYPAVMDKQGSINAEHELPGRVQYGTIWPSITDASALRREERHGRLNLVLGNELWEKHKGNWGQ